MKKAFPRVVVALFLVLFCFCPCQSSEADIKAQTQQESARTLAMQVVTAFGGMAKVKDMKELGSRSTGKVSSSSSISSASNDFDCKVLSKGDKIRLEMDLMGQPTVIGYDGKTGWTQHGDWVTKSTDTSVKRLTDELKHSLNSLANLAEPDTKIEDLGNSDVNGKACMVLKITSADGLWTKFFIDPKTHLVSKSEYMGMDHEQAVPAPQSVFYSDYRNVGGYLAPFRMVEYVRDRKTSETILSTLELDSKISDDSFSMPKETEISRLREGPVVIPFEYLGNEIVVSVRLNSNTEAKFIVDTGASQTVLDKQFAHMSGPVTAAPFNVTAGAKAVPLNITRISQLSLGDVQLHDVPALVTDLSSFAGAIGQRPAGLIGANVLRRFLVTFDYEERKLILADPHQVTVPPDAVCISTSPAFGASALVVSGKIDDKATMNFLVDTGAAFNNLPRSLAKSLNIGEIISVGQIYGLDGQKINIGSVKLSSLKIGDLKIDSPVFALAPDSAGPAGLFTAGAIGILGNPIWSQFRMTVDYRNEKLILENSSERKRLNAFRARITEIDRQYLRTRAQDPALRDYEIALASAKAEGLNAGEALVLGRRAGVYADKYGQTKNMKFFEAAVRDFDQGAKLALESRNRQIEGDVLAQWAMFYMRNPRNNNDIASAQRLFERALRKSPMDAGIFAAIGSAMVATGKVDVANKLIDQALMLDPANWSALWTKYRLAEALKNDKEKVVLLAQLSRYYPDFPEVMALNSKIPAKPVAKGKKLPLKPLVRR